MDRMRRVRGGFFRVGCRTINSLRTAHGTLDRVPAPPRALRRGPEMPRPAACPGLGLTRSGARTRRSRSDRAAGAERLPTGGTVAARAVGDGVFPPPARPDLAERRLPPAG